MKPQISIVIPTWKHLDKLVLCCESIIKYTDLSNIEILIVANGCGDDGTKEFVEGLGNPFRLIWIEEQGGYAKPTNVGMKEAVGDYIILLNNDTELLEQPNNQWIEILLKPLKEDESNGLSAPMKVFSESANAEFLIFFCVMISRKVIDTIGYLDEVFISYSEDIDYCMRAVNSGFKLVQVPVESNEYYEDKRMKGVYPIFHEGNCSHKNWKDGDKLIEKNNSIIRERYNKKQKKNIIVDKKNILCSISTKGRYETTLPLAIMSIINQTLLPDFLAIYDDNDNPKDLNKIQIYQYLFATLYEKGVECFVYYGDKKGQHYNHQRANTLGFKWVWRVDDDCISEPNVLEILYNNTDDTVGAIGGSILTPPFQKEIIATGKIENIRIEPNLQWDYIKEIKEVDHLHCSYLYRAGIEDFCLELSNKAHREESMHTYGIKRKGYKVLLVPCVTWHYKAMGGIRSDNNIHDYEHDEKIFNKYLNQWGIGIDKNTKMLVIDGGLGDTWALKNILSDIQKKYKKVILAVCYPDVFFDVEGVRLISIQDAKNMLGEIDNYNIYTLMDKWNWKGSLIDAFKKLYL